MAIIKCKMCGGNLSLEEDMTVAECEYCGTVQTVPKVDDEKKLKLFERANRLRAACDFDKAYGVYESIVADFDTEAEAYWGLILCKFGIEYVDDPATGKKVPTCHRSGFDCVLEDENFELVMENCDDYSRRIYREEAKTIEELRKSILAVSSKEEPYDVFISYKELDATGERTIDSVIAQDIYERLTEKGYRVFFSRISLEDKLGVEYEPYIFAALNSAKLMLVVGTAYENFNAVWVKNEWSRYLAIMSKDHSKMLIPCFKDIDAYDMPKEFNKLAAQDMGKVGAMQDLLRGVEKILGKKTAEAAPVQPVYQSESSAKGAAALKRGYMALEDGEWQNADKYFEQALELDAECAEAYWGKVLAFEKCADGHAFVDKACRRCFTVELTTLDACKKNVEREAAAIKKYCIPNYLNEDRIASLFDEAWSVKFESATIFWKKKKAEAEAYFERNRDASRAFSFAQGAFADEVKRIKSSVLLDFEGKINDALIQDEQKTAEIKEAYAGRLEEAEAEAAILYKAASEKIEADYKELIKKTSAAVSADELIVLISEWDKLTEYKDSTERGAKCRERLYLLACETLESAATEKEAEAAAEYFRVIIEYKDSRRKAEIGEQLSQCIITASSLREEQVSKREKLNINLDGQKCLDSQREVLSEKLRELREKKNASDAEISTIQKELDGESGLLVWFDGWRIGALYLTVLFILFGLTVISSGFDADDFFWSLILSAIIVLGLKRLVKSLPGGGETSPKAESLKYKLRCCQENNAKLAADISKCESQLKALDEEIERSQSLIAELEHELDNIDRELSEYTDIVINKCRK